MATAPAAARHRLRPDRLLRDGDLIEAGDWSLRAIHTPGHMGNHLSFLWDDQLFCGDVVLGWSSTLISPPDGDLVDYFRQPRTGFVTNPPPSPAHGAPVDDPAARIAELGASIAASGSAQILHKLRDGPADEGAWRAESMTCRRSFCRPLRAMFCPI